MISRRGFARALLPLLLAAACGGGGAAPPNDKPAAAAPSGPAPAAAGEGALCEEHGVLEAVCTKCNPALIAVFKAKGDFCEQHGFPESFCPICHPERGGKPVANVAGDDGAPADGTKVRFKTKETARLAGLELAPAVEAPGDSALSVTATIVYDATRVAQINARASGVVQAIRADVGAQVKPGAALAVIESAGVGADQARLQAAQSRVQIAEANHQRASMLRAENIAPEKSVLAARQELEEARAELAAARAALGMVGRVESGSRYTLTAPIAGVVTQRGATIGRLVGTEELLFEIVDTSQMWAELDLPESDVRRVAIGQPVALTVEGLGDRELTGTLSYVAPQIDVHTRTAKGRVALANADGALRGNMFARARVAIADSGKVLKVPRAAVQRAKDANLVFVRLAEDVYEARRVQVGAGDGDLVAVSGRLAPGDQVVTVGSFLLKTETLKESIGAGCCEVEEKR